MNIRLLKESLANFMKDVEFKKDSINEEKIIYDEKDMKEAFTAGVHNIMWHQFIDNKRKEKERTLKF